MTNSTFFVAESKNSTSFDVYFLKNRFELCLTFVDSDENADVCCVAACSSCRSSLFSRLILMSTVTEIVFDKVCICFEIRSKFAKTLLDDCLNNIVSEFWKISMIFDQTIEIISELEKSCLCLKDAKDNRNDLFSIDEEVESCDISSNFRDFWKLSR